MSRQLVIARWPDAVCESETDMTWNTIYAVWNMPPTRSCSHMNSCQSRILLGQGNTKEKAWARAAEYLKRRGGA